MDYIRFIFAISILAGFMLPILLISYDYNKFLKDWEKSNKEDRSGLARATEDLRKSTERLENFLKERR